jgi:hypothetical protein
MNRRALEGREKALGKEHPDTLTSISNLASVLQDQGKLPTIFSSRLVVLQYEEQIQSQLLIKLCNK